MARTRTWAVFGVLFALGGLGCDPTTENTGQTLKLEGHSAFASGAAVAAQTMGVDVTLEGHGFFSLSEDCAQNDPHMLATLAIAHVSISSGGAYTASGLMSDFRSDVNKSCSADPGAFQSADVVHVVGEIPASLSNCNAFCAAQTAKSLSECLNECTNGGRKIFARRSMSPDQVAALVADSTESNEVRLTGVDLTFNELSPAQSEGTGPDLQVDGQSIVNSVRITTESFDSSSCAIYEGCLRGPGRRTLLRFDGVIMNLGNQDFQLGNPVGNDLFEFSACHGHYHFKEAMRYELIDPQTGDVVMINGQQVVGHKQGFCMLDMRHITGSSPSKFTCTNQGLTPGWADVYYYGLDCQWIDITSVPAGDYLLRVTVNPNGVADSQGRYESNPLNNSAEVPVFIP